MPDKPHHSPKFNRCRDHVMAAGHDMSAAYAICTAAGIKSDGADDSDSVPELSTDEIGRIDAAIAAVALKATKSAAPVLAALKLDATRREATGVFVKAFDGTAESLDLDGEAVSLPDVYVMARLFMEQGRITGHDDQHDRSSDVGTLVEIFVNDDRINSPNFPKNAGVATMRYSPDEWALVVSGQRTGFSFDVGVFAEIVGVELLVPASQVRLAAQKEST